MAPRQLGMGEGGMPGALVGAMSSANTRCEGGALAGFTVVFPQGAATSSACGWTLRLCAQLPGLWRPAQCHSLREGPGTCGQNPVGGKSGPSGGAGRGRTLVPPAAAA